MRGRSNACWRPIPCCSTLPSPATSSRASGAARSCMPGRRSPGPDMCGPMRGAIAGAIVLEGWAGDLDKAAELAAAGGIAFHPNHHFGAVGPMTGLITPSMPVMAVENRAFGNRAYCTLNEGLGKVMRFGGNDAEVLARLRWLAEAFGPALGAALREAGGIPLKSMIARRAVDGRRDAPAQCRLHQPSAAHPRAVARARGGRPGGAGRAVRIHRRQRPVLPQRGDGDGQGDHGPGARYRVRERGHRDEPQRDHVRHPGQRSRRSLVHRPGGDAARALLPGFLGGRRQPGYGRFDDHRDRRARRLRHGRRAGRRRVRRGGDGGGRARLHPRHGGDHRGAEPRMDHPRARLCGRSHRHRHPQGGRHRPDADDQYRDRPQQAGIGQVGAGVVRAPMACFERALEAFAAEMGIA